MLTDLQLYNTLTHKKENFIPLRRGRVGFYSCGPTVYDYPHIGNMRAYVCNDLLKRVLIYNGYQVKHIMNITDVGHLTSDADSGEDKMEKAKRQEHKSAWEIARFYTKIFKDYCHQLNILPPTKYVTATSQIKDQITYVKKLYNNGWLYKTSDGLYFDTSKLSDYGILTGQDAKTLKAGARVAMSKEKKHPTDFAVWKFSPAHSQRDMEWNSPWGKGFPGWHLECSVIATKFLGDYFDIHSGGVDHIPIHHTNEIAQTEALTGEYLAHHWIHYEFLQIGQNKMAKSGGKTLTMDDIAKKGISPLAFRYLLLQTHYAKRIEFSWEALGAADKAYQKLLYLIASLPKRPVRPNQQWRDKFKQAINNDLNIPSALSVLWDMLKDNAISPAIKRATALDFDKVFGLGLQIAKLPTIPALIQKLARARWQAKQNKDFAAADKLRKKIEKDGFIVQDDGNSYTILPK